MKNLGIKLAVACFALLQNSALAQVELVPSETYIDLYTDGKSTAEYTTKLVHETDSHYYVYHRHIPKKTFMYVINKSNLTTNYRMDDPFEMPREDERYEAMITLGTQLYVVAIRAYEEEHKAVVMYPVTPVWWNGSTPVTPITLLEASAGDRGEVHFKLIEDHNGRYLGIAELLKDQQGRVRERIVVYDAKLEKIAEQKVETTTRFNLNYFRTKYGEITNLKKLYQEATFDDRGNILIPLNQFFLVFRADRDYELQAFVSPDGGLGIKFVMANMDYTIKGDTILVNAELVEVDEIEKKEGDLSVYFKPKLEARTIGYYSLQISRLDYDILNSQVYLLQEEEREPEENLPTFDVNKNTLNAYVETLVLEDGTSVRISENIGGYYGRQFGNISLVKFNAEGEFEWVRYIEKSMSFYSKYRSAFGKYSFQYYREGDNLTLFYYDWPDTPTDSLEMTPQDSLMKAFQAMAPGMDSNIEGSGLGKGQRLMLSEINLVDGVIKTVSQDPLLEGVYTLNPFTYERQSKQDNKLILLSNKEMDSIILKYYSLKKLQ